MRTTIDIPDDLYRELKVQAATRGVTLREIIVTSAREMLKDKCHPGEPSWKRSFGGLSHLREETSKIQSYIDQEFSRIDTEEWQ